MLVKQPRDSGCGDGETGQDSCSRADGSGSPAAARDDAGRVFLLRGPAPDSPACATSCGGGVVLGEALPKQGTPERQFVPLGAARPFVAE